MISDGKSQIAKMGIMFKNIFNFTGEMKSCSLNVKLLPIQSANSVSKQWGLAGAYSANLQQLKLNITLAIQAFSNQ